MKHWGLRLGFWCWPCSKCPRGTELNERTNETWFSSTLCSRSVRRVSLLSLRLVSPRSLAPSLPRCARNNNINNSTPTRLDIAPILRPNLWQRRLKLWAPLESPSVLYDAGGSDLWRFPAPPNVQKTRCHCGMLQRKQQGGPQSVQNRL